MAFLVTSTTKSTPGSRRRAVRDILIYGICGGVLISVLKLTEYRFLIARTSILVHYVFTTKNRLPTIVGNVFAEDPGWKP